MGRERSANQESKEPPAQYSVTMKRKSVRTTTPRKSTTFGCGCSAVIVYANRKHESRKEKLLDVEGRATNLCLTHEVSHLLLVKVLQDLLGRHRSSSPRSPTLPKHALNSELWRNGAQRLNLRT